MYGLVLEGGGMRAGFVAGALLALIDKGLTRFDVAIAISASVPSLVYFVSGQRYEMETVWREELNTPKLVCYRNIPAASLAVSVKKPVINIDYLVYEVFQKKYPVNIRKLMSAKTRCLFAATRLSEEDCVFLSADPKNIYKTMKACMALPGCYPGTVCIDGEEYIDGGTVNSLPVDDLMNSRVKKVLAILTKPLDWDGDPLNFLDRTLFWRYFKRYDWIWDKLKESKQAYVKEVNHLEEWEREKPSRALIIAPDKMPPASVITRNHKKINQTVDMGYSAVENLENEIRDFLQDQGMQ